MLWPDLSQRDRQPELMDQPGLDPHEHRSALAALARVNRLSRTAETIWPSIRRFARSRSEPDRPVHILDVACGGGDVALSLHHLARRASVPVTITGVDLSETALAIASENARRENASITYRRMDVLRDPFPTDCDVVTCSLFLHHLEEDEAIALFRRAASTARMILASDLDRGRPAYLVTWFGTRMLSRSRMVHVDGPLSVRAAFTPDEMIALAERAGLRDIHVRPTWPWRWLLRWQHPDFSFRDLRDDG